MSPRDASEEAPAASLVGSLSVFELSDVLLMLASAAQTGELLVVSEAADGRVWLDGGELCNAHVGAAATIGQAVFELACVNDGWFYFTSGLTSSNGQPAVSVAAVLDEVRPQVDEWREIRQVVPLESVVSLSPEPPEQDVQIRSDQWRVLTTVGTTGHSVRSVLEVIGGDQVVGLRTLRDLREAGLITLEPATAPETDNNAPPFGPVEDVASPVSVLPSPPSSSISDDSTPDDGTVAPPPPGADSAAGSGDDRVNSLAEVAMMPPPIAGDPWTPSTESVPASDNGVA